MADIIYNMLGFARKNGNGLSTCNMRVILDNTLELAKNDFNLKNEYDFTNLKITTEIDENLPLILCSGPKVQQVLLNLLRNGAQAMEGAETVDPAFNIRIYLQDSSWLVIEIVDNGPGMSDSIKKNIFQPFFTTKPLGVGTGLGLSVSYFIITENHKGEMTDESPPGQGAKFIVRLPV